MIHYRKNSQLAPKLQAVIYLVRI